jgi:protein-disulfide isomerase
MNKKNQKKGSNLPYVIIGLVLVVLVGVIALGTGIIGAGWWVMSRDSSSTASTSTTNNRNQQAQRNPANAPPGAPLGVNVLGSPTAVVTVEEFADYQCGACAATHPVMKEIQSAYAGNPNFKFVFRHFPLSIPAHAKAYDAALATESAGMQGKYWQMQDLLFRNQSAWSQNPDHMQMWEGYASSIGVDVTRFKADMGGMAAKQRVDADLARGRGLGVNSTPTVLINGQMVPPAEVNVMALRRNIDAAIQQATAGQAAPASSNSTSSSNK